MRRTGLALPPLAVVVWAGCGACSGGTNATTSTDASTWDGNGIADAAGSDSKLLDVRTRDGPDGCSSDGSEASASAKPIWQDMSGLVGGCKVQRLANPQDVRVFTWVACDSIPGCERAVYDQNVISPAGGVGASTHVRETPSSVIAAVVVDDPPFPYAVMMTNGDGHAFDGYRTHPDSTD